MSGRLILVRHGQSHANVERRLDTLPPGADLTDLGREQARAFGRNRARPPGLVLHSIARRAEQTAAEIAAEFASAAEELTGIHEVQAGDLEGRDDDAAIAEFNAVYQRWHQGSLDVAMPGGETGHDVLGRYLPVVSGLRVKYLDDPDWTRDVVVVSHGAAIRLTAAILAGVESSFVLDHHLANAEAVTLVPVTEGRWSCVQWGSLKPPFHPEPDVHPVEDALHASDPMG
jgi:probable phosphoglycerate mutase